MHPSIRQLLLLLLLLLLLYGKAHLSQSFQIDSKLSRAESFEACSQWVLLNVQIITLLITIQKYIYPPVSKGMLGLFVFP